MKKQTLVILAIVVGLSALLTGTALGNEEGYKVSQGDAIVISIGNVTVTDFLNATNYMTTVQVYNFKDYKGENTWMVQWSSLNRSLDVYVNVATGNIVGIEEQTDVGSTPTPTPAAFQITNVNHPSSVINGGDAGDLEVWWDGNPTFPVTMIYRPKPGWGCPQGGCTVVENTFHKRENPLVFKGALWCRGYKETNFCNYEVLLRDAEDIETHAIPAVFNCIQPTPTPTPTWTLTTFIVDGNESSPISAGKTITARFDNGTISGTAGCNRYFGLYTVVNEITIGENLVMTMMYCSEPIMDQESQYTNILLNVATYTIEENQLTLSTEDGRALVYQAESDTTTPTPTALPTLTPTDSSQEGTIWTLTSFIVDGNESSPIQNTTTTARFNNGTISGTAGCNQYFGSYTVVNEITIGGEDKLLGMTMMLCSEPIMDQEAQYTDILLNVATYTIEENQLTLSTGDNKTLVYLVEEE